MQHDAPPLLSLTNVAKRYPGVVALRGVDLTAQAGEVHALVGANGAGKSTLMNLISGAQSPSDGEIRIGGQAVRFSGPAAALQQGIATVYQELSLVPDLSVARNIYLGREPRMGLGLVDQRRLTRQAHELLNRFGLRLDPDAQVAALSIAEQQLVELARALSFEARILILDEPTAVLSLAEQDNLFAIIRRLRDEGMLVLYVSHHLREVIAISDRVTVLRDGKKIATRASRDLTVDDLVEMMIGHSRAYERDEWPARPDDAPGNRFRMEYDAAGVQSLLELHGGEIVGVAGLVGAGRTTLARALAGRPTQAVSVRVEQDGRTLQVSSPREAMRGGIVYITEDRKRDGIFADLDIVANATASALPGLGSRLFRNARREYSAASQMLQRLRLVASGLRAPIVTLSGGNQQKVLIARALLTKPKLLICDEPTRGVDVGAKAEIHTILRDLARSGVAVLVVSSEIEELLAVAHRIVVMHQHRLVADMPVEQADESTILIAASGGSAQVREQQ